MLLMYPAIFLVEGRQTSSSSVHSVAFQVAEAERYSGVKLGQSLTSQWT